MSTTTQAVLVDGKPIQYDKCPECARETMRLYIEHGYGPGSGYTAILADDLRAVVMVDDETLKQLPAIYRWIYNYAPLRAYGSYKEVHDWMREREAANG